MRDIEQQVRAIRHISDKGGSGLADWAQNRIIWTPRVISNSGSDDDAQLHTRCCQRAPRSRPSIRPALSWTKAPIKDLSGFGNLKSSGLRENQKWNDFVSFSRRAFLKDHHVMSVL